MKHRKASWVRWFAVLAVFAMVVAACGDDDDATTTTAAAGGETTTTAAAGDTTTTAAAAQATSTRAPIASWTPRVRLAVLSLTPSGSPVWVIPAGRVAVLTVTVYATDEASFGNR